MSNEQSNASNRWDGFTDPELLELRAGLFWARNEGQGSPTYWMLPDEEHTLEDDLMAEVIRRGLPEHDV